jgi:hypothetical protein
MKIISSSSQATGNQSAPSTEVQPSAMLATSNRTRQPPTKHSPAPSSATIVDIYEGWDWIGWSTIREVTSRITAGITSRINSPFPYVIPNAYAYTHNSNQARVSAISASVPLQRRNSNVPSINAVPDSVPLHRRIVLVPVTNAISASVPLQRRSKEETLILLFLPGGF